MGRPRKNVAREPNGRPQRESAYDKMREVLVARCQVMGWPLDPLVAARDVSLATLPGRMRAAGLLDQSQCNGLLWYAEAHGAFLRAIGAPKPWPKCAYFETAASELPARDLNAPTKIDPDEDDEKSYVRRVTDRYMNAHGALLATGKQDVALFVLNAPETAGPHCLPSHRLLALRKASSALAKHFSDNA